MSARAGCDRVDLDRALGACAIVLTLAAGAHAQSAPEQSTPQQSARHTDAHADRVLLVPSAETHPQGTLFASSYEIIILTVGYAFSDRVQASITGSTDGHGGFGDLDLKANLLRSRYLRMAVLTSIDFFHTRRATISCSAASGRAASSASSSRAARACRCMRW